MVNWDPTVCPNHTMQLLEVTKGGCTKLAKTEHNTYFIVSDDFYDKVELLRDSHLNLSRENRSREKGDDGNIEYGNIEKKTGTLIFKVGN